MAANIQSMFYAGQVPWHGMGTPVETEVTSGAAIKLAELDWKVGLEPVLFRKAGQLIDVPHMNVIVRQDNATPFGVVGHRYNPIQNADAFEFMDGIVGENNAVYHTAGALGNGSKVWLLVKLPDIMQIGKADRIDPYILLMLPHDGLGAMKVLQTYVRVVCQNTMNLALGTARQEQTVRITHRGDVMNKLQQAQSVFATAREYFQEFQQVANTLAEAKMPMSEFKDFVMQYLPDRVEGKVTTHRVNQRRKITDLFRGRQKGYRELAVVRGTRWGALNAVVEFEDWHRSIRGNQSQYLDSLWLGSRRHNINRALRLLQGEEVEADALVTT